jgi:hypothetical protein
MIDESNVSQFEYSANYDDYEFLLNKKIIHLECKHIMKICNSTQEVYDRAIKAGHQWCIFGSHRNGTLESEKEAIAKMVTSSFNRPMRVVITKDNKIWADNTHSAIAYILRYGKDTFIKEVPVYIVDTRLSISKIVSVNNTVNNSVEDIKSAIACSERLNKRINDGYRPITLSWMIEDLISQLNYCI